jgi:hypothetical protein
MAITELKERSSELRRNQRHWSNCTVWPDFGQEERVEENEAIYRTIELSKQIVF